MISENTTGRRSASNQFLEPSMKTCPFQKLSRRALAGKRCARVLLAAAALLFPVALILLAPALRAATEVPAVATPVAPAVTVPVAPALLPAAPPAPVAKEPEKKPKDDGFLPLLPKDKPDEVEIVADTMDMDFGKHISTFQGNVLVTEARMRLQADKMVVYFGETEKPEKIEAIGNVVIHQPEANRTARAGRAEYDMIKGTITLLDNPSLKMGDNSLDGASKITYYRDNERVICDGGKEGVRPVIQFMPKGKTDVPDLFSVPKKNAN